MNVEALLREKAADRIISLMVELFKKMGVTPHDKRNCMCMLSDTVRVMGTVDPEEGCLTLRAFTTAVGKEINDDGALALSLCNSNLPSVNIFLDDDQFGVISSLYFGNIVISDSALTDFILRFVSIFKTVEENKTALADGEFAELTPWFIENAKVKTKADKVMKTVKSALEQNKWKFAQHKGEIIFPVMCGAGCSVGVSAFVENGWLIFQAEYLDDKLLLGDGRMLANRLNGFIQNGSFHAMGDMLTFQYAIPVVDTIISEDACLETIDICCGTMNERYGRLKDYSEGKITLEEIF